MRVSNGFTMLEFLITVLVVLAGIAALTHHVMATVIICFLITSVCFVAVILNMEESSKTRYLIDLYRTRTHELLNFRARSRSKAIATDLLKRAKRHKIKG